MSIAVTAVVRPSLCLRLLMAGFGALALGSGLLIYIHQQAFSWPLTGAGASIMAGLILFYSLCKNRNTHRIDISGVGQIRLTVYPYRRGAGMRDCDMHTSDNPTVVELMAGSTLWPGLLLLRLRAEDGTVSVIPVFTDSVGAVLFRPLCVACRAIAARQHSDMDTLH